MARTYLTVNPIRLSDPRTRGLGIAARLLWCHLLVSELATRIPGVARGGALTLADHLGLDVETTSAALAELVGVGLVEADEPARVLVLAGVADDHRKPAKSAQMVTSWARALADLPPSPLLARHILRLRELSPASVHEGIAKEWAEALRVHGLDGGGLAVMDTEAPPRPHRGPTEGSPRGHRGVTEAPPRPHRGVTPPPRSRSDLDLDQDQDLDPPSSPPRGTGGRGSQLADRLGSAAEHLARERSRLFEGFDSAPDPLTPRVHALARKAPPEVLEAINVLCTRACLRRRDELEKGRGDYRGLLTLEHILRTAPEYLRAAYLDRLDRPTARGDPSAAQYVQGPDNDDF